MKELEVLDLLKNISCDDDDQGHPIAPTHDWDAFQKTLAKIPADKDLNFANDGAIPSIMAAGAKNARNMKIRAELILDVIDPAPQSILEVGGAYGGLCNQYLNLQKSANYSIIELEEMLRFASVFLSENKKTAQLYPSTKVDLAIAEYDLFTTWMAISEMDINYQASIFDLFLPRCKYAIIAETKRNRKIYEKILTRYYGNCRIIEGLEHHSSEIVILFSKRK